MTPEQQKDFDGYMRLADFFAGRFDARRAYEWKLSLGLWAALLGAAKLLECLSFSVCIPIAITLFYGMTWLRGVWLANENDKSLFDHYRRAADGVLADPAFVAADPPGKIQVRCPEKIAFGFLHDWSLQFQLGATALASLLSWAFLNQKL